MEMYKGEPLLVQENLQRMFQQGALSASKYVAILPVDHGFEHGPIKSFDINPPSYDPEYHFRLALESGMSALAAPVGFLNVCASQYASQLPLILKVNSSTKLLPKGAWGQANLGTIEDALRLKCVGVGVTIYPGAPNTLAMLENAGNIIRQARDAGLFTIVWCYPRGPELHGQETDIEVNAYAAHIGVLLGAHIIKVKLPSEQNQLSQVDYITKIVQASFSGRRMVLFSGGKQRSDEMLCQDMEDIVKGGGYGVMMGQNIFKRCEPEAKSLIRKLCDVLKNAENQ